MKKHFSAKWKASKQPRKQRKYLANAPLHLRKKFLSINLSKELKKKYGKRNLSARKGDLVKIKKGKFKNKTGKIIKINLKKSSIIIEGIQIKKTDGSKVNFKLKPSNLQIMELNLEDKKRINKIKQTNKEEKENALKKTKST